MAGCALDVAQISCITSAHTLGLGGSVDRDKDEIRIDDRLVNVGGEKEVFSAARLHNLIQAGLVDWEDIGIPGIDARLVQVDDCDSDVGVFSGNNGTCGATCRCPQSAGCNRQNGSRTKFQLSRASLYNGGSQELCAAFGEGKQRTNITGTNAANF